MQVAPGSTLLYLNSWPLSVATMLHILGLLELLFLSLGQSSLRHSKEYEEVCGWEWQGQYIHLHHAMMSGERRGRYIVVVSVKAGMADVMHGYISAFSWAIINDHVNLIPTMDELTGTCIYCTYIHLYGVQSIHRVD